MSEVAQVPQLRFPEFSGNWESKIFRDVFERITTKNKENNENVLTISAQQGLINQKDYFNKSVSAKDVTGYYLLHKDDFAYNKSYSQGYPLGAIKRLKKYDKGVVSTLYICFKSIQDNIDFLEQVFNGGRLNHEIHKIAQEGARNHGLLNISVVEFFKDIKLNIPTKPEQQKIAAFLTAVDTKIEQLSKKQELLGEYKKGLMQQIFSQAIRFKADDGSTFPEWKEKKLGDIVRFENGKGHEQNISKDGKFIVVNSKFISSQGRVKKYTDTQKSPLNFGDVVMVMSDVPNGKALAKCYYIEQDNLYSLNQRICGLKHKLADTKFIYYRINRHKYFLSFDSGVGQTNLKKMEILNCPLNIPTDIKEQAKIANFLSSVDNKIEQMGKQLDESKQFKKALLQQMFV